MAEYRREFTITEEELHAVEDAFFAKLSEEERKRIYPLLVSVWEKLCPGPDEELVEE